MQSEEGEGSTFTLIFRRWIRLLTNHSMDKEAAAGLSR